MSNAAFSLLHPTRAWQVLCAGIASLVLTTGLARFAYTPLLPLMQAQAGMGDTLGGWLATINYAGYMTGALIASAASDAGLRHRLYRAGLTLDKDRPPIRESATHYSVFQEVPIIFTRPEALALLEGETKVRLVHEAEGRAAAAVARGVFAVRCVLRLGIAGAGALLPQRRALAERYPRVFDWRTHWLQLVWAVWPRAVVHRMPRADVRALAPAGGAGNG